MSGARRTGETVDAARKRHDERAIQEISRILGVHVGNGDAMRRELDALLERTRLFRGEENRKAM